MSRFVEGERVRLKGVPYVTGTVAWVAPHAKPPVTWLVGFVAEGDSPTDSTSYTRFAEELELLPLVFREGDRVKLGGSEGVVHAISGEDVLWVYTGGGRWETWDQSSTRHVQ